MIGGGVWASDLCPAAPTEEALEAAGTAGGQVGD